MALSPADFYAYSRATGAPVPEDPQERAEIAPEVLEFRRNQLKTPQQESNLLATLGTAALGLGALAGIGFGAKRFMQREPRIPKGPTRSATTGVRQVNLAEMEPVVRRVAKQAAPETVPAPSKVASPQVTQPSRSVMPTEEESFQQYARQLEKTFPEPTAQELDFSNAPVRYTQASPRLGYSSAYRPDPKDINEAALGPVSQEVAAARREAATQRLLAAAQQRQELSQAQVGVESLTDLQNIQKLGNVDQFINAVESGEDQTTGRVIKQINIADPWGESTVPPTAINDQTPVLLSSAVEATPQEKAQSFLQSKFETLGENFPGRYRRERIMGQDPAIAEAMELYASTGDPSVLSRLSETPSSPLTISPRVQTELKEEEIPTGKFFEVTPHSEFVDDLIEKDINLTNRISNLGAQKQGVLNRLQEIDELEPQLRYAAADEPGQGGYYSRMLGKLMFEKQNLPHPDSFNVDIGDAMAERDFIRGRIESLESLGPKYKMLNRQEGVRPFFEVDPVTGGPIAETLEIRSGRPSVQLEEDKTGGGRQFAMFDPESQTKSSIGIYGVEPRNFPIADPELRPTVLQREETKGLKLRQEPNRSTPEAKIRSLKMSEALRRATIEGRDPQSILKQLGIGI